MALIPPSKLTTHAAIDAAYHDAQPPSNRAHLGASIIGRECAREIWYSFRWATAQKHSGRLLRLFERGQEEEARFVRQLKMAGVQVWDRNPATGEQWRWHEFGGHFAGSCDGFAQGVPEAPKAVHLVEMKTHNDKSFGRLVSETVAGAKPEHLAQMNIYLHWAQRDGIEADRWLYIAVNKNDDTLYTERGKYDRLAALASVEKARNIIASDRPPVRVRDDATHYYCASFCDHATTCNGPRVAEANCRTCVSSVADMTDGTWKCTHFKVTLDDATQRAGGQCPAHVFIPDLVPFSDPVDAGENPRFVRYKIKGTDFEFINSNVKSDTRTPAYTSAELQHLRPELIQDRKLNRLVTRFDGVIVDGAHADEKPTGKPHFVTGHIDCNCIDCEIPF